MSIKIEGYEILEKAGGTTDTTIWTARQISLDRNVSIWVMKARAAADPNLVNHFTTITRAISRLKHNNFPPVIDISKTEEGEPYIVFENADSTSITRIIKDNGVYSVGDALKIAKEVALALDAAWKQTGLVHRNLKPDNIRIYTDGNVKIFNFNSATIVQPGSNPLAFDDGMIVGTPNYAAPEQIDCLPSIDFHADMYGLGATLYQMLTGKAPFDEERDPMKILELQRSGHLSNPKAKNPNLSDDVVYLLARLMAKNPDDRYAWWLDVVEDIEHILAGRPLRMVPPNGVVRSTIDQKALVAKPLKVSDSLSTPAPIIPNQSPLVSPIVPVNNTPITHDVYAETIRNFQSSAQEPLLTPEQQKLKDSRFVSPNADSVSPVSVFPKSDNKPRVSSSVENRSAIKKQNAQVRRKGSVLSMLGPSSTVVWITRLVCIVLFIVSAISIVFMMGPALPKNKNFKEGINTINDVVVDLRSTQANSEAVQKEIDTTDYVDFEEVFDENVTELEATTTIEEASVPKSTDETPASNSTPREMMLRKVYAELSSKSIEEARVSVKKIFEDYANQSGINRAECRGIMNVLNVAQKETDAVGSALVKQTQVTFKKLTISGQTREIKAVACVNGVLSCHVRKAGEKETRKISIPLSKVSPQEMYNILLVETDSSKGMIATKALLALRTNNRADFLHHTKKIKALQPFAEFME